MTCSNDRKITFLLQKKDSKATKGWQGGDGSKRGKYEKIYQKSVVVFDGFIIL